VTLHAPARFLHAPLAHASRTPLDPTKINRRKTMTIYNESGADPEHPNFRELVRKQVLAVMLNALFTAAGRHDNEAQIEFLAREVARIAALRAQ
jgi:hypothetical protein